MSQTNRLKRKKERARGLKERSIYHLRTLDGSVSVRSPMSGKPRFTRSFERRGVQRMRGIGGASGSSAA